MILSLLLLPILLSPLVGVYCCMISLLHQTLCKDLSLLSRRKVSSLYPAPLWWYPFDVFLHLSMIMCVIVAIVGIPKFNPNIHILPSLMRSINPYPIPIQIAANRIFPPKYPTTYNIQAPKKYLIISYLLVDVVLLFQSNYT